MRRRFYEEGGFTLLEILVVLMIFSLSVALIFPSIVTGLGKIGLKTTAKKMAASLEYSRNQALRHRNVYYAEANGDRLIIRTEGAKAPVREIQTSADTLVSSKNGVIAFYPGGGSSGGTLKVRNSKNRAFYTIKVEPSTGGVRVSALM